MVKIERTPTPPASLAIEKEKEENGFSGSYNQEDVVDQLNKDLKFALPQSHIQVNSF